MRRIRLKSISDKYFENAWRIYEESFPIEERRLIDAQAHVMKNPNYHFDIIIDEKQLVGFLLWWDFDSYRYIDHFATSIQQRNKGFGKLILEEFIGRTDKPIVLEVELPNSTINQRRINFYERIGFKLNSHYYEVPPSVTDQLPIQLLLISYPTLLSLKDVEEFVELYHPILFKD
ncbi:GNAT family N-acetyltransferase [Aquimarina sediminis]|uniref:GNAT family N-acetyltransferase n=1 Tax=Aquimarina sediminis TaxID=2070536 RepID=UPI000CA07FA8|nr:GNAT family N-acetyltransferase [Aquimarina sediminis]